jgi:hypothetical protein
MPKFPIRAICAWIFVLFIVAAAAVFCYAWSSYATSDEVNARYNQCTALMQPVDDNVSVPTMTSTLCDYTAIIPGERYPERLPNPQINITVKTIHFFWFGDCKVMASTGEVYHSAEDQICMAQPGENLTVYQYRTRDNTITDLIRMEA